MYFKKLEIFGFKSFADRLKIKFEPGITAVVGPNGCGKTNVVDAIKWVMGEQSTHQLRGKRMEDVIFNGSRSRKPLSMAEVSLTLDNSQNILPVDYKEVNIMRRLFRSGESEYYINKIRCRLKDITELFMDTGLGVDSYSLIEQGKVEFIINAKPEERRLIFEEAAGITKYKSRKEEALRKIEKTEQNLERLQDIMSEVKRQIGSLDYQARKARQFQKHKEELKKIEVGFLVQNLKKLEQQQKEEAVQLQNFGQETQGINTKITQKEACIVSLQTELTGKEKDILSVQEEVFRKSSEIIHLEDKIQSHRIRQEELISRKENNSKEIKEFQERLGDLVASLKKTEEDFNFYQGKTSQEGEKNSQKEDSFRKAEEQLKELDNRFRAGKEEIINLLTQKSQVENKISASEIYLENFKMKREKLLEDKTNKEKQKQLIEQEEYKIQQLIDEKEKILKSFAEQKKLMLIDKKDKDLASKESKEQMLQLKEAVVNLQENIQNYDVSEIEKKLREITALLDQIISISKQLDETLQFEQDKLPKIEEEKIFLTKLQKDREQKEKENKLLLVELEAISREKENLDKEISSKENVGAELKQEFTEYEKKEKETEENIELIEEDLEKKKNTYKILQEEMILLKTEVSRNIERVENFKKDIKRFKVEENILQNQIKNKQSELAYFDKRKEELEGTKGAEDGKIENFYKEKDSLNERLKDIQSVKFEINQQLKKEEEDLKSIRVSSNKTQEQLHQFELQNMRTRMEIEAIGNKFKKDYHLDRNEANTYCPEVEVSEAEIESLKRKVESLGMVNLAAPEEYGRLQERWDFLNNQQEDLLKAKKDLHQVINKVDVTTKTSFREVFGKIREHFKEVFKNLFEGGEADLVLTNENDILESGIDIIVQPPGKKLQNISLLSGGEKALTAISLLFAFYLVKPSPFCVFDEVDAPLDDANLVRFIHLLKDFSSKTQFSIITHNKKTMEIADVLYGVTMEEFGVSKLISVRLHREEKLVTA
ncbi:AAA family ATPase [bacterium]|nr:AAA family ATPase [bacterium]